LSLKSNFIQEAKLSGSLNIPILKKIGIFNFGDVVQLKSGGEKMTVKNIDFPYEDQIQCQWFEGKKINLENFYPAMLIKS